MSGFASRFPGPSSRRRTYVEGGKAQEEEQAIIVASADGGL